MLKKKNLITMAIILFGLIHASAKQDEAGMKGDELASRLKSEVIFKSEDGLHAPELNLIPEKMQWWKDAKFGMFIHWGLYAIPAKGEWIMHKQNIPAEEYALLADQFVPRHFDADAWAQVAKNAGMKYMVLTARHHDGFALWDSPSSYRDFCSAKTAAKRDFVAEYVQACRRAGLGVGLYYSPMDWRFPGYFKPREMPDNAALMKQQAYGQIEELMSSYGKIDILWYDGGWLAHKGTDADAAWFWEPIKLNTVVRKYQPDVVINPRSGLKGDFKCNEGSHALVGPIIETPWEKCLNLNNAGWGFNTAQNLLSADEIIRMLINVVGRGGNVLLNVGPDRDGIIPPAHVAVLEQVGDWLQIYGESIYGTRAGPFQPVDGRYCSTYKGNRVYVHVLDWGEDKKLFLPALDQTIEAVSILTGGHISHVQTDRQTILTALVKDRTTPAIIELVLDRASAGFSKARTSGRPSD